jgi:GNAT superfamily N-acetyltransferase
MALEHHIQPEIIPIRDDLRLRKYDGHYELFLPGYQDPYVYQNSEGIFDESRIPDLAYVKGMCTYLARVGEMYYIEAKKNGVFIPVGDVTVKPENPPIAIWCDEFRGKGIGKLVMLTVIQRLKDLSYTGIRGSTVYRWNTASQKLHESLGFQRVKEDDKDIYYDLTF